MANNKIDRINKEIAKTREKITEYQNKLKGLEVQKTEAENLEIVQLVRAMRLTPQELNAMLSGGGIPGMTAAPAEENEQEENADEEFTCRCFHRSELYLVHRKQTARTIPQRQIQGCYHSDDDHPSL